MNPTVADYELTELLGEGAMGRVYAARHQQTGAQVALKTVKVAARGTLAGIRREIRALAKLDDPGIVRIVDHGIEAGRPWYAMEWVEGVSLAQWLRTGGRTPSSFLALSDEAWWTHRMGLFSETLTSLTSVLFEPTELSRRSKRRPPTTEYPPNRTWRDRLRPMVGLCEALAYLHGEGLVHRDLKPDNVLIRPSGETILFDFGLAMYASGGVGRERVDDADLKRGTALYMSPERIEGRNVDARADLYALGCILYEAVAGRPPFTADVPLQLLFKHISEEPVPLSATVVDVPSRLEELISRLLSKDPEQRPGYAEDVASILCTLLDQEVRRPPRRGRTYLYQPRLVGRASELEQLKVKLGQLLAGKGAVVLVGGDAGVGKTRLANELIQLASTETCEVLTGEAQPPDSPGGRGGLHPLRRAFQAVADHCREAGPVRSAYILGRDAQVLARFAPSLADLAEGAKDAEAERSGDREDRQLQVFVSLTRLLNRMGRDRPLLLVLDDLQWADPLTLGWLCYLARRRRTVGGAQPLVIGLYRSEEIGDELAGLVEALTDEAGSNIQIEPLSIEATAEMVQSMLALSGQPPAGVVRFLYRQSRGNPYFVAEYLRTAVSENLLCRDTRGRWHLERESLTTEDLEALGLPEALEQLAEIRLRRLGHSALELARVASVLGREVKPWLVSACAPEIRLEHLDELISRQVVDFTPGGGLSFCHEVLRQSIYRGLGGDRRRELHRRAATALSEREDASKWLAERGFHWERAGDTDRASRCYFEGAEGARRRDRLVEASHLYQAYLDIQEEVSLDSATARWRLAQGLLRLGRTHKSCEESERALREAAALDEPLAQARALLWMARAEKILGHVDRAFQALERAGELRDRHGAPEIEAERFSIKASILRRRGEPEKARQLLLIVADMYRHLDDRNQLGIALNNLGNVHLELMELDQAAECLEQALAIHREVGNLRSAGIELSNLGNVRKSQGRYHEALDLFEKSLDIARRMVNRRSEGIALNNVAGVLKELGDVRRGRECRERALAVLQDVGDRGYVGITLGHLANDCEILGEIERAERLYHQAIDIHHETHERPFEVFNRLQLVTMHRRGGKLRRAQQQLEHAESALGDLTDLLDRVYLECERGHLALASNQNEDAAREALERATGMLAERDGAVPHEVAEYVEALQRAVGAQAEGLALVNGERPKDYPWTSSD